MRAERGYSILECLVYIAALAVVLNLSFAAYYRYDQHTRNLRRNADDITRALRAGERWREDVREATASPRVVANGLAIPQSAGDVTYTFADNTIWRQTDGTRKIVLKDVKASAMLDDPRQRLEAWRWELELASPQKVVLVRPLFSFTALPGRPS